MYTKVAASSEQCFNGTFVVVVEDPKGMVTYSHNFFLTHPFCFSDSFLLLQVCLNFNLFTVSQNY